MHLTNQRLCRRSKWKSALLTKRDSDIQAGKLKEAHREAVLVGFIRFRRARLDSLDVRNVDALLQNFVIYRPIPIVRLYPSSLFFLIISSRTKRAFILRVSLNILFFSGSKTFRRKRRISAYFSRPSFFHAPTEIINPTLLFFLFPFFLSFLFL